MVASLSPGCSPPCETIARVSRSAYPSGTHKPSAKPPHSRQIASPLEKPMTPTTFKMDPETLALVRQAARKRKLTVSEYLRHAARERAVADVACPTCGRARHRRAVAA